MRVDEQAAKILTNEDTLATPLLILCVDRFGTEFFEWEPETFAIESRAQFGIELPEVNRDKIWALVTALTTDAFYKSLETFIPVCNSLNGSIADFDDYHPVTREAAAWGITEVILNDPAEAELDKLFSHEIRYYVGMTLQGEGVTSPPRVLKPFVEYDNDPEEAAGAIIGPDEGFVAMHAKRQKEETTGITEYVRAKLNLLAQQLKQLPLQHGSAAKIPALVQETQKVLIGLPTSETPGPASL
jgi:hypothetical protein